MTTTGHEVPLRYDPFDYAIDADPHPIWRRMRDEAPLYRNEEHDFWALSRFADVLEASLDWRTFSSAHGTVLDLMSDEPLEDASMIFTDPPEHDELRHLVSPAFTPRRIAALEDRAREITQQLLDSVQESATDPHLVSFDFVQDFGALLPTTVISSMLGVPEADQDELRGWTDTMLYRGPDDTTPAETSLEAMAKVGSYIRDLIDDRRTNPGDDLVSVLLTAELDRPDGGTRRLTKREIHDFTILLFAAGNETVARLLGNAAVIFDQYPDQRARLVADPTLLPNAIEELLRYEAPSPVQGRVSTREQELHGIRLPAGSRFLLLTGSAGRDEREYDEPDRFDVTRTFSRHVTFGYGIHFCLGASLARLESRVALEEMLRRFPTWEVEADGLERVHTSNVRGFHHVPVVASAVTS
ncbi:MAG: cytochrome P450 [Acidimicrobiia bacterium]|nr:cytochrome P450 [Acidimicrobiia bacterium]